MKNVVELFINAPKKKMYKNIEFEELLMQIKMADPNLVLDWDEGAGEEWARFIDSKNGIVCMLHSRIGVAFIRKVYEYNRIRTFVADLEIVFVDDYSSKEWYVNLVEIKKIPEVYWHACESAVDMTTSAEKPPSFSRTEVSRRQRMMPSDGSVTINFMHS